MKDDAEGDSQPVAFLQGGLSPSSASTFRQCPRRWKFRYIDKLPDPPGEPALRGTFVHSVLELLLQNEPAERTPETAKRIARETWDEFKSDEDLIQLGLSEAEGRQFRWDAWQNIEQYFALENPSQVNVVGTERDMKTSVGGTPFRGIIDRVDQTPQGLTVTDYKTGRVPSARYLDNALSQVWLYAAALQTTESQDISEVRLLYLSPGSKKRNDVRRAFDSDKMLDSVAVHTDTWNGIHQAVECDSFGPQTGPLCSWCPYRAQCPEGRVAHQRRQNSRRS